MPCAVCRRRVAQPKRIEFPERKRDGVILPVNLHRELLGVPLEVRHRGEFRLHEPEFLVGLGEKHPVPFVDGLLADPHRAKAESSRLAYHLLRPLV